MTKKGSGADKSAPYIKKIGYTLIVEIATGGT